jgi:hypothetical protein
MRSDEMSKTIKRTNGSGAKDRLTPFEVAVLSRVVRASVIPEADLVFAWGTGPWAAPALDGLLERQLVSRREEVSEFVGQGGLPNKPGRWIVPTKAGITRLPEELDVAFPPSGNWLTYEGLPLNYQPPDLLMQLIEFLLVRDDAMKATTSDADIRSARVLKVDLLKRIGEIKIRDGSVTVRGKDR